MVIIILSGKNYKDFFNVDTEYFILFFYPFFFFFTFAFISCVYYSSFIYRGTITEFKFKEEKKKTKTTIKFFL